MRCKGGKKKLTGDPRRRVTALELQAERLRGVLAISQTLAGAFNFESAKKREEEADGGGR